ncbi:MAG: hypothetical protein U9Q22_06035 [Candidatus Altiarchaeota archaeon]|nr:hypothetical protein [Candidatus Altiarchaeota archaeon]
MRYRNLIIISLALLMITPVAYAVPPEFSEFLKSNADAVLKHFSELSRRLTFSGMILGKIDVIEDEFHDNLREYLLKDPPLKDPMVSDITKYFIKVLEPFYVTAIILVGMYLMFFSGSPQGRSKAKSMILQLLVGMVIISLSLPIMQLLSGVSQDLTRSILSQGPLDIGVIYKKAVDYLKYKTADFMWIDISIGIPFLVFTFILAMGLFVIFVARYILLIFLIIFFPFAIFLGLFHLTKDIGQMIIKQLLLWMFLPVGYALALVIIVAGSQTLIDLIPGISDVVNLSGTLLLIISPLILFGLMNWLAIFAISAAIFIRPLSPLIILFEEPELEFGESEEEEKHVAEPTAAVGLHGYEVAPEEGGLSEEEVKDILTGMVGMWEKIPLEEIQGDKALYNSLIYGARKRGMSLEEFVREKYGFKVVLRGVDVGAYIGSTLDVMVDINGEISLEAIQRNKGLYNSLIHGARERGMSLEEFIREKYGFRLVSGEGYIKPGVPEKALKVKPSRGESMTSKIPAHVSRITPKKTGMITVTLPPRRVSPVLVVNVPPGGTERVEIAVRNEGRQSFSKVVMYDEDLLSAGIMITYVGNKFRLGGGEERVISIMINPRGDITKKFYKGSITVKTEEGVWSRVDVYVNAQAGKKDVSRKEYVKRFSPRVKK